MTKTNENVRRNKMTKFATLIILAITIFAGGVFEARAQNAKDMFTQYNNGGGAGPGQSAGREGAKICVLLKRGNQPEKIVSTNETFYSGDKIKLVFDINFTGYAAIVNTGTSGNESLLFPYLDSRDHLVSHQVSPNSATQLPRGNDWIVFDKQTGDEMVNVIFSRKPIVELDKYEEAVTNGSDGMIASQDESDQIMAELNSKSLKRMSSKDLSTQTGPDGTYGVAQNGLGNEPVAFTFYLKHR
jgi:hypothetical protein